MANLPVFLLLIFSWAFFVAEYGRKLAGKPANCPPSQNFRNNEHRPSWLEHIDVK
jgi:hypothetical protein